EGETFLLDAGNEVGSFLWQDGSTSSSLLVNQPGLYSVTVTNQCGSGTDSTTVAYTDTLSQLNLGADINLCPGEQYIFDPGVDQVNYVWQDMSTADTLIVSSSGIYHLQVSNVCDTTADTVMVVVNDSPPVVNLPASINLCAGESIVIDAGIVGVQFVWNDGSILSSITTNSPGTYSVTVSNSCGEDADSVVVVDAGPQPSVTLGTDTEICPGEQVMIAPTSNNVDSWLWQDGSTGSAYNVTAPGVVIVEGMNECGVDSDTMIVSQLPAIPSLYLGPDTSFCEGDIIVLSITEPDVNILWEDGTSDSQYVVSTAGIIYATISNPCGFSSDSVSITLLPAIPLLDLGNDQSLCPGETFTISPLITGVDFLWHDGSSMPTFSTTLPIQIILTISNECGSAVDTLVVIEDTNGPRLDLGEDVMACEGEIVTILSGISGVDYLWQDGNTTAHYTTSTSGTFVLNVSNACGTDIDTIVVDIGKFPTPSLGPDTVLCDGNLLQLSSNADDETQITWQDGSTLPVFNVTSSGLFILSEENDCGLVSDSIIITYIFPPAEFDLGPDTILCPGEFILLLPPVTDGLITWHDGSHANSFVADKEQIYSLEISNICGSVYDERSLSYDDNIPHIDIDPVISMCPDQVIALDATQLFNASYEWNTGSILPVIQVITPGLYEVKVTTPCESILEQIELIPGEDCHSD
ncbi:MAG: hypothetical protein ABIQ11_00910, partial [Saprospiraceae bacterium]